jgi:hypothetical protein
MAGKNYLVRVTLPELSGIPQDATVNNFALNEPTGASPGVALSDATNPLAIFYNAIGSWLSHTLDRTIGHQRVDYYDITTHEGGSPHGSPVFSASFGIAIAAATTSQNTPADAACVLSLTSSTIANVLEHGQIPVALPSSESAIDQGAPISHQGLQRPKGRQRGRIYLGPLDQSAFESTGSGEAVIAVGLRTALVSAASALKTNWAALTLPKTWCTWSRRDATLYPVAHGWVDDRIDTVRRRKPKATIRTTF